MGEICQRCGEEGEDRRTLWMACFYAMNELNLPFEQAAVKGKFMKQVGSETMKLGPHAFEIPQFEVVDPDSKDHEYKFFLLRVCKECRGDWLGAIKKWFKESKTQDTGLIPVRVDGAVRCISEHEYHKMQEEKKDA